MMDSTVIPVLAYPDVAAAVEWLCSAFGFSLRLGIGDHRAQLYVFEDGHVVVRQESEALLFTDSVMVRVEDVDAHFARAVQHGASIVQPPADMPYGERQYSVKDFAGRTWTFSQSVKDVDPSDWGGQTA
jgi:uncharacterized glyoxalase superfamily protein PhnB